MRFRHDTLIFWLLVITLVTGIVYARSLQNGFVDYDDGGLIVRNEISHGLTPHNIGAAFSQYDPELYIPLTFVSYQIDYVIAGLAPWIYHAHSIILFALASVFAAWTFYLLSGRNTWVAAVTGLLYALHPIQSESVLWAAARKDVQAAMFFWLACALYLKYRECKEMNTNVILSSAAGRSSIRPAAARATQSDTAARIEGWLIASLVAFSAALLSKVSVIVLPVALLLFEYYWGGRRPNRASLQGVIPYVCLSFIFGIIALFGKGAAGPGLMVKKALIGAKATVFYLWKLVLPFGFSVLYPYTKPLSILTPDLLISVILVLAITAFAILMMRRYRVIAFAWFFYLLCLLPSFTNFAKGSEPPYDVYIGSDRYALLAVAGIFFAVAVLLERWRDRSPMVANGAVTIVCVVLAALTFIQIPVWHDTESLFAHTLAYYPDAQTAHNNLGGVYFNRGEVGKALAEYQAAVAIRPSATAHFNLAQVFRKMGNDSLAIEHYGEAARLNPASADALVNLSVMYLERKSYAEAADVLQKAETIDPGLGLIPFNLGLAYEGLGKKDLAIAAFKRALELDPGDEEAREHLKDLGGT